MLVGRTPHLLPPASAAFKGFNEVLVPVKELIRRQRLKLVAPAWAPLDCNLLGCTRTSLVIGLGRIDAFGKPQQPWVCFLLDCDTEEAFPIFVDAMGHRIVIWDITMGLNGEAEQKIRESDGLAVDVLSCFIAGLCALCYETVLPDDNHTGGG